MTFPKGSEWRKWDLHVHVPGTKLNDAFEKNMNGIDWDRFADALEGSDVAVFGITDYFSADTSLAFIKHYKARHPRSAKLLLVNVELRLNENVNKNVQMIDFHVIFNDKVSGAKISEFLSKLPTQHTDGNQRHKSCAELTGGEFSTATVSRAHIKKAFDETFGPKADPIDYLIYLAPANNNGLRAQSGAQRKASIADEVDKVVHAIFGKDVDNSSYFLREDRYDDSSQKSIPKPVFGGCDAHSFEHLDQWLGKAVDSKSTRQVVTWVKADPTFAGLQQTLVEPADRVSLAELQPDAKERYKVIKQISFTGSDDFPEKIEFNPNLNAIIGSRSSGKSALLAHIAHAVDPEYTIKQQVLATKSRESDVGPAAGHSWKTVESTVCEVEWADGSTGGGQVIYVPQNWLYQLSDNPHEVTLKIQPVLEARYPSYFRKHQAILTSIKTTNAAIERAVDHWFELAAEIVSLDESIKQLGDKASIVKAQDDLKAQIEVLSVSNSMSADELEAYQSVVADITSRRLRIDQIVRESDQLSAYVVETAPGLYAVSPSSVAVETTLTPAPRDLPSPLSEVVQSLIATSESLLTTQIEEAVVQHRVAIRSELAAGRQAIASLEQEHAELLAKYQANVALTELVGRQKAQQRSLGKFEELERTSEEAALGKENIVRELEDLAKSRGDALDSLTRAFEEESRVLDQLTFGIAVGFDPESLTVLSEPFRKSETGPWLKKNQDSDQVVDILKAQASPNAFLGDLFTKKQKLNRGRKPSEVARQVLTATPEPRFTATLDRDRIGGFVRSTMTPGKQALFALTLILGEAQDGWALLIDQPEDDLDSRSIYIDIVRYLVQQKKQRQIILVTHNANLVVGADAEEVLVANRHGDDRKNRGGRTFEYYTGSLEDSRPPKSGPYELERMGIREHAVEILDGGEEAFQKRRAKYKI